MLITILLLFFTGKHFADEGFGVGDVLGCLIDLPRERPFLQKAYKKLPIFKFKSYLYFEEKDDVQKAIKELKPLQDAKIVYYKNGTKIGTAFENIYNGVYYPAAGLFKNISITFNFGPHFDYPPTDTEFGSRYRGMNEAAFDNQIEQTIADMVYLVDNESKGTLSVKNFYSKNGWDYLYSDCLYLIKQLTTKILILLVENIQFYSVFWRCISSEPVAKYCLVEHLQNLECNGKDRCVRCCGESSHELAIDESVRLVPHYPFSSGTTRLNLCDLAPLTLDKD